MIGSQQVQYQNMLETIIKQARKADRNEIVAEATKALSLVKNIIRHANKYVSDVDYVEGMKAFKKTLSEVRIENPLHELGTKVVEIPEVEMSLLHEKNYKKFQIIVFNQIILAIELKVEEEFSGLMPIAMSNVKTRWIVQFNNEDLLICFFSGLSENGLSIS